MKSEPVIRTHKPWHRRKGFFVMLTTAGILFVSIIVVAVFSLMLWTSSPEKALSDAFKHVVTQPGTYYVKGSGRDLIFKTDGKLQSISGKTEGVQSDIIIDKSTVYIKTPTPEAFMSQIVSDSKTSPLLTSIINLVVGKIKGKWLVVNINNLPKSGLIANNSCLLDASNQLKTNQKAERQIVDTYKGSSFINIDVLNQSKTAKTYQLQIDNAKLKVFFEEFKKTDFYKSLELQCDSLAADILKDDYKKAKAEVTLDRSKHTLQSLKLTDGPFGSATVTADYSSVPNIKVPTEDVILYGDIANEVSKMFLSSVIKTQ